MNPPPYLSGTTVKHIGWALVIVSTAALPIHVFVTPHQRKPVAGQQFDYAFDTIGNRTRTLSGGDTNGVNLRVANYYANNLNQITNRDVLGTNDVVGAAGTTGRV